MIYDRPEPGAPLTQGDIIDACPLIYWTTERDDDEFAGRRSVASRERVLVLTQACDLANSKTTRIQVAVVHETETLINERILKRQTIRDQVQRHRVFGWYFLPAQDDMPESIVNLRELHTINRELLEELIEGGMRRVSVATPYREHLAQHFAVTYSRIALPDPF